MRIIAGDLKGRRLESPDWEGLRPTSDRLRETLFNVLGPRFAARGSLDGYAGTGAVGIEALSRGAAHVTFVEQDPRAVAADRTRTSRGAASETAMLLSAQAFADADRRLGRGDGVRHRVSRSALRREPSWGALDGRRSRSSAAGTLLVIEHARRDRRRREHGSLTRTREVTSGDSALAFYRQP